MNADCTETRFLALYHSFHLYATRVAPYQSTFYAKFAGVVTSAHVTKMTVTPFIPP